jgi:hypothetical protein
VDGRGTLGAFGVLLRGEKLVTLIPAQDLKLALDVLTPRGFRGHRPPSAVSKISLNPFLTHDDIHALIYAGVRISRFRISSGGERQCRQ